MNLLLHPHLHLTFQLAQDSLLLNSEETNCNNLVKQENSAFKLLMALVGVLLINISGFCSMKQLSVFLPLQDGMPVHQGSLSSIWCAMPSFRCKVSFNDPGLGLNTYHSTQSSVIVKRSCPKKPVAQQCWWPVSEVPVSCPLQCLVKHYLVYT